MLGERDLAESEGVIYPLKYGHGEREREREERTHALIQYVYSISLCGYMCV